jgi:predicted peptidase
MVTGFKSGACHGSAARDGRIPAMLTNKTARKRNDLNIRNTLLVLILLSTSCDAQPATQPALQSGAFEKTITKTLKMEYVAWFPKDFGNPKQRLPLLICLHGSGECGYDLTKLRNAGVNAALAEFPDLPFIAITPQLSSELDGWSSESLDALLDNLLEKYPIDADRVYLTGYSWGAYGVWDWACHSPQRFAAIAPISGEPNTDLVDRLVHVPVWAFHGAKDKEVWPHEDQKMVELLTRRGGDAKLTMYQDVGHNAWTRTYRDPELYAWLLKHRRAGK